MFCTIESLLKKTNKQTEKKEKKRKIARQCGCRGGGGGVVLGGERNSWKISLTVFDIIGNASHCRN